MSVEKVMAFSSYKELNFHQNGLFKKKKSFTLKVHNMWYTSIKALKVEEPSYALLKDDEFQ